MTQKEKAKELVDKFKKLSKKKCDCLEYMCVCFRIPDYKAKKMALICVDEIIKSQPQYLPMINMGNAMIDNPAIEFYEGVKQEIEKL